MKRLPIFSAFLIAALPLASQGGLIISEIVDGSLSGGLPKFVELTNTGTTPVDLSNYSIGNFSNGGTNLGGSASLVLSGMVAPGDSYVLSYENSDGPGVGTFFDVYGFDADSHELGTFINGDDVVAIFDGPATGDGTDANIVDVYGVIGVNGDGEVWDYTDGFAYRLPNVVTASATFNPAEWSFGGLNSLAGADATEETNLLLALTSPGSHEVIPEPSTYAAIFGLAVMGLAYLRRRR